MKRLFLLTVIFFSSITLLNANDTQTSTSTETQPSKQEVKTEKIIDFSKLSFETDKGSKVSLSSLICGVLRKMEKGERYIVTYTSSNKPVYGQRWSRPDLEWGKEVPVVSGYLFGAFMTFANIPKDESVQITIIDTPPQPIEVEGKKQTQLKQTYYLTLSNRKYNFTTTFKPEEPQMMQYGTWRKDFYNNDKLIFSYSFELVKPTEEELKRGAEYDEYLKKAQESAQIAQPQEKK